MTRKKAPVPPALTLAFDDNRLLARLVGEHGRNLAEVERIGVRLNHRGNEIAIAGDPGAVDVASAALHALYDRLKQGGDIGPADIAAELRFVKAGVGAAPEVRTRRGVIRAHTQSGGLSDRADGKRTRVRIGPGRHGQDLSRRRRRGRDAVARPRAPPRPLAAAVEAGEKLGYLPGDVKEKVDPYLRPLYDALFDMLPGEQVQRWMESGEIEIAPLAFMRGRTLAHAFVILDEAQNATGTQMRMFLTRLGEGSRMAITGDPSQTDLVAPLKSGLVEAEEVLRGEGGVGFVRFDKADVVRHPLVTRIVGAYGRYDDARKKPGA